MMMKMMKMMMMKMMMKMENDDDDDEDDDHDDDDDEDDEDDDDEDDEDEEEDVVEDENGKYSDVFFSFLTSSKFVRSLHQTDKIDLLKDKSGSRPASRQRYRTSSVRFTNSPFLLYTICCCCSD